MNISEVVGKALQDNIGRSTRSEDLEDYSFFLGSSIDLRSIINNTNQVIFGRRGSGKTLVSGATNELINKEFEKTRMFSIFFSATSFRNSAEWMDGLTVRQKAGAFFSVFIDKLAREVFHFADKILADKKWYSFFNLKSKVKKDKFITSVLELLEITNFGVEFLPLEEVKIYREKVFSELAKGIGEAGVVGEMSASSPEFRVRLEAVKSKLFEDFSFRKEAIEYRRVFSPKAFREKLVEIVDALELECLVIFVDEWMSLDECQVEFAERLRRCFLGEKKVGIKIAADPYQSIFNNSGSSHNFRGLELEADIFEVANLEYPFCDKENQRLLYSEALFKRLSYFEPRLIEAFGECRNQMAPNNEKGNFNHDYFIESVFLNNHAFEELYKGAQGIPRDFLTLFEGACKRRPTGQTKVDHESVQKSIEEFTIKSFGRIVQHVDGNKLLNGVIKNFVIKTGSRRFAVESLGVKRVRGVKHLLSKRIIHEAHPNDVHFSIRNEYSCFDLNYGIFLDFMRTKEYTTGVIFCDDESISIPTITKSNIINFSVKKEDFGVEEEETLILCNNCNNEFSSFERSYAKKGICPFCFEIVVSTSDFQQKIFFVGPSGSGKSAVGRIVSEKLGWTFFDTDKEILAAANENRIADIFETKGESFFRESEKEVIARVERYAGNAVIATGGGLPAIPGLMEKLDTIGTTVFLKADLELLWKRLCWDPSGFEDRPLLKIGGKGSLNTLIENRIAIYESASIVVETSGLSLNAVSDKIISLIRPNENS